MNDTQIGNEADFDRDNPTKGKKYSAFVGRWQPFHPGHQWLIDQRLNMGKNVLLLIRDVPKDKKNPWTASEIHEMLVHRFNSDVLTGRIAIRIIPDIESLNYGRDVGYEVIEHVPPADIAAVSATKIREQLRTEGKL